MNPCAFPSTDPLSLAANFLFARENEAAGAADAVAWERAGVCEFALR